MSDATEALVALLAALDRYERDWQTTRTGYLGVMGRKQDAREAIEQAAGNTGQPEGPATSNERDPAAADPATLTTRKTHCVNGHPFDDDSTYQWHLRRYCRTCTRDSTRRTRARLAAEAG